MNKNIKLKSCALILAIGFSTITPTSIALAGERNQFGEVSEMIIPKDNTLGISDSANRNAIDNIILGDLKALGYAISNNKFLRGEINSSNVFRSESDVRPWDVRTTNFIEIRDDMVLSDGESLAAHQAYLTNNTGRDQTLSSASFDYTQNDSVTTTSSHAVGTSMTTTAEMKFPFVSGSMSMTVGYDFNNTNSVTTSTEKKWSVPSQQIIVPAGHRYKVTWLLNVGTASGTTDLSSNVFAVVPFARNQNAYSLGNAIKEQEKLVKQGGTFKWKNEKNWKYLTTGRGITTLSSSKYSARFGTELIMSVTDETTGRSVAVNSIPMDVTPEVID